MAPQKYALLKSAAFLAVFGLDSVFGQTAKQPAATAPAADSKEEVVELSPFVVNASEDNGYQATNTLAGNRLQPQLPVTWRLSADLAF